MVPDHRKPEISNGKQESEVVKKKEAFTPAITVKEILDRHPQALQVFLDMGLLCGGCPTEAFHTLADVAREYGLDPDRLLQRFQCAIEESDTLNLPKP
jgi:hybrid cluster-associated redox disulfide protein